MLWSMPPFPLEHSSVSYGARLHILRSYDLQRKIFTPYLLTITYYLIPKNTMKKETIKYIIQLIVAILTAIGSTLSVTTAASGAPAEGVALLGGTIVGTGWLHHLSTLV